MDSFTENVENIKLFHRFLSMIINSIEEGNKVNTGDINYLGKLIKEYFDYCEENGNNDTNDTNDDTNDDQNFDTNFDPNYDTIYDTCKYDVKTKEKQKENRFLEKVLNDKYENKKIRKLDTPFYKNLKYNSLKY